MLSVWAPRERFSHRRKKVRTTKIDVNIDATIPAMSVTAKPFTGPVPNWYSTMAVRIVDTFESTMAGMA